MRGRDYGGAGTEGERCAVMHPGSGNSSPSLQHPLNEDFHITSRRLHSRSPAVLLQAPSANGGPTNPYGTPAAPQQQQQPQQQSQQQQQPQQQPQAQQQPQQQPPMQQPMQQGPQGAPGQYGMPPQQGQPQPMQQQPPQQQVIQEWTGVGVIMSRVHIFSGTWTLWRACAAQFTGERCFFGDPARVMGLLCRTGVCRVR